MQPTVLMYASYLNEQSGKVVDSFENVGGIRPTRIGSGVQHSWQKRIELLYAWCSEHPEELVLHIDAFDTCCVAPIGDIEPPQGIIFSAETNCWPDPSMAQRYPKSETPYRFLNAGLWLAKAKAYTRLVEHFGLLSGVVFDQLSYAQALLAGDSNIELDTNSNLFHNLFGASDDWEITKGVYRVRSTGSHPLVVHGNGGSGIEAVWEKTKELQEKR